ncbi:hypothetical protein ACFSCX_00570 [Bacillus salitolerans]|uniref:Uracil DNA glycosylase superfamily protein n=1 Tax=Bacillus salitolerans TaxID=1437434 RepID=A0ABW4LIW8_9BACI
MKLHSAIPYIKKLPDKERFEKSDLLIPPFLLDKHGPIEVYYAAHNEYINQKAIVLIVGITPGWVQMEKSIWLAKRYLYENRSYEEIIKLVKSECRFAGSMRKNLITMLDDLELQKALSVDSCNDLFHINEGLLHSVSLIKFPVFIEGENYNGHTPPIAGSDFLRRFLEDTIKTDLLSLENTPFVIPLGKAVETILHQLIDKGILNPSQCLFGFPHPSGANGHRHKQFRQQREVLAKKIKKFF